jgi:glycosyltransferase involved in cell wall biosynthesis
VDGLRAALERAIKTPREQLVTIGQKNTTYLDTHFSWRATAKVLEDVYNEMRSRKA